jgi:hypothetical protein
MPSANPPTIHEASCASGASGAVVKGAEIDFATAVARRRAELDIVVCGDDLRTNTALAQSIEAAVGPYEQQHPHLRVAGRLALPHFQQRRPPPAGHSFYETPNRKEKAMKYFTPELYQQCQSPDDDVQDAVHVLWEETLERYEQHLHKIEPDLPEHMRYFLNELLLHDAAVWTVAREGDRFIMVMRRDFPPRDVVILTYTLAGEPVINTAALPDRERTRPMEFMYDELDLTHEDGQKIYMQSILFSNGWEIQLRFRDVQVVRAAQLYPAPGTMLVPVSSSAAVQPA